MPGDEMNAPTKHYAKSSMGDALCGVDYDGPGRITAWKDDTTCPRCLDLLAEAAAADIRNASAVPQASSIRVPLPGSGFMVTYRSQGERERTLRLAEARQQIAHEGSALPTWQELTDDERGTTELSARNWLRAAERAGLIAEYDAAVGVAAVRREVSRHGIDWRTPRDLDPQDGSVWGLPYEGDESTGEDY